MAKIPPALKTKIARLVQIPLIRHLMMIAVRIVVARHRIGVVAVPIRDDNQVLMLNHVFHPIAPWGLPGGWLDRGEDPHDAVLRELFEETGLRGSLGPVLFLEHDNNPQHLTIAFLVYPEEGEITLSGEILEAKWSPVDQLPGPRYGFTDRAIEAAFRIKPCLEEETS